MTTIHREIYGQGEPLVMLHGWAMHTGIWREFAQQLGQHCQVICLDLPGHGRSEVLEHFTLEQISSALLAAIPVPHFSLLGWSLGGTIAMDMLNRCPERVKKLIVLAGNPLFVQSDDWPGVKPEVLDGFAEQLNRDVALTLVRFLALQVNGLAHGKALLQTLKHAMLECSPPSTETLQAGLEILKQSDLREVLIRNQCPISLIQGDRDTLIPQASAHRLRQLNPAIDVHLLDKAGHVPFLSHPQPLANLIAGLL